MRKSGTCASPRFWKPFGNLLLRTIHHLPPPTIRNLVFSEKDKKKTKKTKAKGFQNRGTHPLTHSPTNLKLAGELFFKFIFETCTNMNLEIVLEWVWVKGCLADGVAQRRECCPSLQKVMRLGPAGEQGSVHSHIIISKARPCRCCLAGVPLSRRVPSHSGLAWALVEMLRVIVRQP